MTPEAFDVAKVETTFDPEADAAYIRLAPDADVKLSSDYGDVIVDRDVNGHVIGVEVLCASAAYRTRQALGEAGREAVRDHADEMERLADA